MSGSYLNITTMKKYKNGYFIKMLSQMPSLYREEKDAV